MDVSIGSEACASESAAGLPVHKTGTSSFARPVPPEFATFMRAHTLLEAKKHYGIGSTTLARWRVAVGLTNTGASRGRSYVPARPVPDDFAEHAPHESNRTLAVRYRCSRKMVTRWRAQSAIAIPRTMGRAAPRAAAAAPAPRVQKPRKHRVWARDLHSKAPQKDDSTAGRAQQFLQRSMPCFKAEVLDKLRTGYVVGGRPMSTEDMIAYAEAKGFDQREWTRQ